MALRAGGQCVGPFLGQIHAPLNAPRMKLNANEDDHHGRHAADRIENVSRYFFFMGAILCPCLDHQCPERRLRMMTPVVKSENPMIERKKSMSRESSTPFWKLSKCVIDAEGGEGLNQCVGQPNPTMKFVTGGYPTRIRNRQDDHERMKLTTWLRVIAEVMQLIAR